MAADPWIVSINEIPQLAHTAWFSLLGYLDFVGIALPGIEDADVCVPLRQTKLPRVNVSIPTANFFRPASILEALDCRSGQIVPGYAHCQTPAAILLGSMLVFTRCSRNGGTLDRYPQAPFVAKAKHQSSRRRRIAPRLVPGRSLLYGVPSKLLVHQTQRIRLIAKSGVAE
jgi:hypothetical protein